MKLSTFYDRSTGKLQIEWIRKKTRRTAAAVYCSDKFTHADLPDYSFSIWMDKDYVCLNVHENKSAIISVSLWYCSGSGVKKVLSSVTVDLGIAVKDPDSDGFDVTLCSLKTLSSLKCEKKPPFNITHTSDEEFIPDVIVYFEMEVYSTPNRVGIEWKNVILSGMHKLFENETLTDITFQIGAEKIYAHRALICAVSPVLQMCIESGLKESVTNVITVNFPIEIFKTFLNIIYCQQELTAKQLTQHSIQDIVKLYEIVHYYQVEHLEKYLCSYISGKVNEGNLVEILMTHVMRRSKLILASCLNVMKSVACVKKDGNLNNIRHWKLVKDNKEIMDFIFDNLDYIFSRSDNIIY